MRKINRDDVMKAVESRNPEKDLSPITLAMILLAGPKYW